MWIFTTDALSRQFLQTVLKSSAQTDINFFRALAVLYPSQFGYCSQLQTHPALQCGGEMQPLSTY